MHEYIPELKEQYRKGEITRREFIRTATLLGMSAAAAGTFVGDAVLTTRAAHAQKRGGVLRVATRVQKMKDPATFDWVPMSNVARQIAEYLTVTDHDNITHPYLLERWEASNDLKTWTLRIRKGVQFQLGGAKRRELEAADVVWNIKRWLAKETGSSIRGLLSYLSPEGVEEVDRSTVRLHLAIPQMAVPEHLFHYPAVILAREYGGDFLKEPWGTGPFVLDKYVVGEQAVVKRRADYWQAGRPYLDEIRFLDLGEEESAHVAALASRQADLVADLGIATLDAIDRIPHAQVLETKTAQTAVIRMRVDKKPFDDERVRNAVKLCQDHARLLELAHRGRGAEGADHHVAPVHPAYAPEPTPKQDIAKAKALLAAAGYPNGIDLALDLKKQPNWEPICMQAFKEMAAQAGIRIQLNVMPSSQYWEIWDKTTFGFTAWTHRPLDTMVLSLAFRCRDGKPVAWNETQWCDPAFEKMLDEAEAILDPKERRKVMARIQPYPREHGPIGLPFWRSVFQAGDKRIKAYRVHPTGYVLAAETWLEA
ncbi:MAG: ABC transporter substrate-binding protein [Candidatus Rokubacteria bacterium]|nr:ABC transporter substrate-binding protein [Candidatus Rokubacteria bacterium]